MSRSSHSQFCLDESECPGGNCEGCKDGARFCDDPRCRPNCKDCAQSQSLGLFVFIVIGILIFILILGYFIWYRHMEVEKAGAFEESRYCSPQNIYNKQPYQYHSQY